MLYVVYFQKPCVIRTRFMCVRFWSIGIENEPGLSRVFFPRPIRPVVKENITGHIRLKSRASVRN